jgi:hypothetical protein
MKKLFISCPMKGRTEENIKKSMERMHKMAEIIFDQELEVIPSYIEHNPPENNNQAIWYLGESLKKLADADYFIGVSYADHWHGCYIEHQVARNYGIQSTTVDIYEFMPDCLEIRNSYYEKSSACMPKDCLF